jgi:hypothetical protein
MHESSEHISFITPHMNQLQPTSEADAAAAAEAFPDLLKDAMLAQADALEISEYTTLPNTASLNLQRSYDDGSRLYFGLVSAEAEIGSLDHKYQLYLHDYPEGTEGPHTIYKYNLEPGAEEIIRSDHFPLSEAELEANRQELAASQRALPPEHPLQEADACIQRLQKSQAFEREMGINHLPVGPDEIQHVRNLIDSLYPTPPPED